MFKVKFIAKVKKKYCKVQYVSLNTVYRPTTKTISNVGSPALLVLIVQNATPSISIDRRRTGSFARVRLTGVARKICPRPVTLCVSDIDGGRSRDLVSMDDVRGGSCPNFGSKGLIVDGDRSPNVGSVSPCVVNAGRTSHSGIHGTTDHRTHTASQLKFVNIRKVEVWNENNKPQKVTQT